MYMSCPLISIDGHYHRSPFKSGKWASKKDTLLQEWYDEGFVETDEIDEFLADIPPLSDVLKKRVKKRTYYAVVFEVGC